MKFNSFLVCLLFLCSCAVDSNSSQGYNQDMTKKIDNKQCENLTNAAGFEYDSGQYQDCVNTFSRSLKAGCGSKYGENIYRWMAGAYIELDKLDSAKIVINDGLKILPNDRGVIGVAATLARKQNDTDNQLFFLKNPTLQHLQLLFYVLHYIHLLLNKFYLYILVILMHEYLLILI